MMNNMVKVIVSPVLAAALGLEQLTCHAQDHAPEQHTPPERRLVTDVALVAVTTGVNLAPTIFIGR
jgi:hypothetical protein